MLVRDTIAQERSAAEASRAEAAERSLKALEQEIRSNTISVEDDAGMDISDLMARMGRPLTSTEVQRRIKLINPNLIFERCIRYPELTGVYIERDERNAAGGWLKRKVHLFGMESGIMPEFSVLHKTKKQVPNKELLNNPKPVKEVEWDYVDTFATETRGWRTVLIRLLKAELITRADVEKHFGWAPSKDSHKWHSQTS